MFINYLKTAFRNLLRQKIFSIINIAGLAIGLAASIMIAMWVFDELSYDRFHENADRIYRIERDIHFEGKDFIVPVTGAVYGKTIREKFPDVVDMVRVDPQTLSVVDENNTRYNQYIVFTEPSFFNVFTFPLAKGDPETALKEPNSLVLSPVAAKKYFGDEDPMNKILRIENEDEFINFKITGVLEELPSNKHFSFEVLGSFTTLEEFYGEERMNTWLSNYLYTYLLVKEDTDPEELSDKFDWIVQEYILPAYIKAFANNDDTDSKMRLHLRPVTGIHLKAGLMWDIEPQGDATSVFIFSIVAFLILLIACFNFMNLSTALAGTRSLEIGVRKTVGSSKAQIIRQFLGESMITTLVSFVIALGLIEVFLPSFNTLTEKQLSLSVFDNLNYLGILLIIIIATGLIAGIYPSFYLAAIRPVKVLKGKIVQSSGKFSFRQILVILQFTISIALIIGTIIAYRQLSYVSSKPLSFIKENQLVVPVESNNVRTHFTSFRSDLLSNPSIEAVSLSQKVPAEREYSDMVWTNDMLEKPLMSRFFAIDFNFFDTYGLEVVAGRSFSEEYESDKTESRYIINETAVKKLGLSSPEEAIGRKYGCNEKTATYLQKEPGGKIIGVVKDFHFQSLKKKIEPLTMFYQPDSWMSRITIRYAEGTEKETIPYIEETFNKHFPDVDFNYSLLEDYLNRYYVSDTKLRQILVSFTTLAIIIACLGLFGLATFIARQRIKEIGIRKTMGATIGNVMYLLSISFSKWVLIANVIAWPLAYYFLDHWLANFQYHINLNTNLWIFILSGLFALVIALITVSYKAYIAGRQNPVNALRYE